MNFSNLNYLHDAVSNICNSFASSASFAFSFYSGRNDRTMSRQFNKIATLIIGVGMMLSGYVASAQLPADAVDLSKVKISEKFKAEGAEDDAAKLERWTKNYIAAMSTVWCPVTDEITPGGLIQWTVEGITWESCCAFCDESVADEDFPKALDRLKERAKKSFELTGGKYVEGAKSPIDGAIMADAKPAGNPAGAAAPSAEAEPAYMKGKTLKPTYAEGIGLIFDNRCTECHHKEAVAPMSFMSYPEIKKWTKSMKNSVMNREMPPWPADPAVGAFSNSRHLTAKEMDLLKQWMDAGYPQGEGAFTPATPSSTGDNPKPDSVPAGASSLKVENTTFSIPAGAEKFEAKATHEFKEDAKIVSLTPIVNQRGKSIVVTAKTPDGKTTELLRIKNWLNDWKYRYDLAAPLAAPKGTVIEMTATYDNSKLNVSNPDPTKEVKAGADGELCELWLGLGK